MDCQIYRVGRFTLQPFRQVLEAGVPVPIGRKAIELLSVLAKAEGALVTKDELMAAVWPNAIVEDNALQVHVGALRKLLGTDAELLSTVHGYGYRLVASPQLAAADAGPVGNLPAVEPKNGALTPVLIAAAAIVAAAVAATLFWIRPASVPAQPAVARFAVLPFDTLSDGPQARHFADSLTDEIVTGLNSNRIQVVSRDDAATLRGSDRDRKVAELGVALLLDGTVRDDGNSVKVRVHLDDPVRHATLWSGSVDGPTDNGDQLQARIASTIVAVLACSNRALVPAHGLTDPDLLSRYLHACDSFVNETDSRHAYEMLASLREVAAKAPDFTPAHSDFAKFATYFSPHMPPDQAAPLRQEAEAEAHKALALDPKSPDAYLALSQLQPPTDWAGREKLLRQGVAGDPEWPFTNGVLGLMLADTGRLEDAAGYLQKAAAANLQIDLRPQNARLQCGSGQFEPAMSYLSAELKRNPIANVAWFSLRNCLKYSRRWADLRAQTSGFQEANRQDPSSTLYDIYLVAEEFARPADVARARNAALAVPGDRSVTIANAIEALSVLGFTDDAFAVAQRITPSAEGDSAFLFYTLTAPLRRDPRFMQLAARIRLVDYWRSSGHWPDFCGEPGLPYNCRSEAAKVAHLHRPSRSMRAGP
jgi:TolB-like protein/DNA-binding winged helix-turn-helix (wHTH) protein